MKYHLKFSLIDESIPDGVDAFEYEIPESMYNIISDIVLEGVRNHEVDCL